MAMIKQVRPNYDPVSLEKATQEYWESEDIYRKTKKIREEGPDFYFLDGPPYTTGSIHLGTAMNKALKDTLIRYWRMNGLNVRDQPGFDMHGLPIEVQVEKEVGVRSKQEIEEYGIDRFVETCKIFALDLQKNMSEQFRQLGVWMDWDNPYLTVRPEYIEAAWWTIQRAHEQGLLVSDDRVLSWCPRCETALAEAEIEYWDEKDPSIYVKFPLADDPATSLLIWTTTPWTLPANMAVAVHPDLNYVKVEMVSKDGKEGYILAESQVQNVAEAAGYEDYYILERWKGRELEGRYYIPPFHIDERYLKTSEWTHRIVLADYVEDANTGIVHIAPGHGPDDFETGKKYGIDPFCPVDGTGCFSAVVPQFQAQKARSSNRQILEYLEDRQLLLHQETTEHRYGHCWRCRSPVIFRNTHQWFIRIEGVKDRMRQEVSRVKWTPDWAGNSRQMNWVDNARDWCISRQRYWGIPLPVWTCDCGERKVIGSFEQLKGGHGYIEGMDPHRPWIDGITFTCPKCSREMRRVPDVLDVWFDSGVASWAQLGYPSNDKELERWFPGDFITEAHDQTRGWFYSQLAAGIISFDSSPYEEVLMHGWVLDPKGQKMSKSKGNVIQPLSLIEEHGADSLRFYLLKANAPWEDLAFQKDGPKNARKVLNTLWNVVNFASTYMALDSYEPYKRTMSEMESHFRNEDRWMISRTERLRKEVTESMETRHVHKAARALEDYILEDLSRWYVRLVRDRMWKEEDDPDKMAAYFTLHYAIMSITHLLAPFCPHITEEIYANMDGQKESVHMSDWPSFNEALIDDSLEFSMRVVQEIVELSAAERQRRNSKLRWPIKRMVIQGETELINNSISLFSDVLKQQANVKDVEFIPPDKEWDELILRVVPNPNAIGKVYRQWSSKIAKILESRPAEMVKNAVEKGEYEIGIEGQYLKIEPNMVSFRYDLPEGVSGLEFSSGKLYLDFTVTPEIEAEGYTRELIRRIQQMRKDMHLDVEEYIRTEVAAEPKLLNYFNQWREHIMRETRSRSINFVDNVEGDHVKAWDIQGKEIKIGIKPVQFSEVSQAFNEMGFLSKEDIIALNQSGYYDIASLEALSSKEILSIPGLRIAEAMKIANHLKKGESPPIKPAEKKRATSEIKESRAELERGGVYLIIGSFDKGYSLLKDAIATGKPYKIVTRIPPSRLPLTEGIDKSNIIWLSNIAKENSFNPHDLLRLQELISDFLDGGNGVVMIDGLEYLISNNDFLSVLRLIQNLRDQNEGVGGIMIITLNPKDLENHELTMLEKEVTHKI